jgi:hypothetical protein
MPTTTTETTDATADLYGDPIIAALWTSFNRSHSIECIILHSSDLRVTRKTCGRKCHGNHSRIIVIMCT